jgi:hypothetical protein
MGMVDRNWTSVTVGGVVGRVQLGWVGLVLWLGRRIAGIGVRGAVVFQDGG